jgi:hypothetical protein
MMKIEDIRRKLLEKSEMTKTLDNEISVITDEFNNISGTENVVRLLNERKNAIVKIEKLLENAFSTIDFGKKLPEEIKEKGTSKYYDDKFMIKINKKICIRKGYKSNYNIIRKYGDFERLWYSSHKEKIELIKECIGKENAVKLSEFQKFNNMFTDRESYYGNQSLGKITVMTKTGNHDIEVEIEYSERLSFTSDSYFNVWEEFDIDKDAVVSNIIDTEALFKIIIREQNKTGEINDMIENSVIKLEKEIEEMRKMENDIIDAYPAVVVNAI